MTRFQYLKTGAARAAATAALALPMLAMMPGMTTASAGTLVGLAGDSSLVQIDPATGKVTGMVAISGVPGLVGIDVRPADGRLYGLAGDGRIVTIDPGTGEATVRATLSEKLSARHGVTVDFNPAADRLRVMTPDGTNLRVNVDDGKAVVDGRLAYADMHKGETPNIVAGAYTNSRTGRKAEATALYDIDATIGALVKQAPPNDGVLTAIGRLGVTVDTPIAFNIVSTEMGGEAGWMVNGGVIHKLDLATGKATALRPVEGAPAPITDIAWME
ncbi:DUF4394 domain-containing protein [Tistrella mobilis]|nr:DUF4394 domain-containing protein [Tistrella mobilis]